MVVVMKQIILTKNQITLVDDEDYDFLMQWKWYARASRNGFYATRTDNNTGQAIWMHKEIIKVPKGKVVDHINRNSLDNQKQNLRICSQQENCFNRGKFQDKHLKGVNFSRGAWTAYIKINGKQINLGRFSSEHKAALVRDLWARDLQGKFADLNFKPVGVNL
jgi:hypothetical protein